MMKEGEEVLQAEGARGGSLNILTRPTRGMWGYVTSPRIVRNEKTKKMKWRWGQREKAKLGTKEIDSLSVTFQKRQI